MAGIVQDWEPVVIRKKAPTAAARKDEKAVNAARRAGAEIETIRKCTYLNISFLSFVLPFLYLICASPVDRVVFAFSFCFKPNNLFSF